jgi:hypothetical protein
MLIGELAIFMLSDVVNLSILNNFSFGQRIVLSCLLWESANYLRICKWERRSCEPSTPFVFIIILSIPTTSNSGMSDHRIHGIELGHQHPLPEQLSPCLAVLV